MSWSILEVDAWGWCANEGTSKTFLNFCVGWVGVKDVAMAHILAYEKPEAEGRYIVNTELLHYGDMVSKLAALYPQYPIVAKCVLLTLTTALACSF